MILLIDKNTDKVQVALEDWKRETAEILKRSRGLDLLHVEGVIPDDATDDQRQAIVSANFPETGKIYKNGQYRNKTTFEKFTAGEITEAEAKAALVADCRAKVNRLREQKLLEPINYNGWRFDADSISKGNLNDVLTAISNGVAVPDPLTWVDHDNEARQLSHLQLVELAAAFLTTKNAIYQKSFQVKAELTALTVNELEKYDEIARWNS